MKTKTIMNVFGLLALGASLTMCTTKTDTLKVSTPEEAIAKLMAGNERYINETSIYPRQISTE